MRGGGGGGVRGVEVRGVVRARQTRGAGVGRRVTGRRAKEIICSAYGSKCFGQLSEAKKKQPTKMRN